MWNATADTARRAAKILALERLSLCSSEMPSEPRTQNSAREGNRYLSFSTGARPRANMKTGGKRSRIHVKRGSERRLIQHFQPHIADPIKMGTDIKFPNELRYLTLNSPFVSPARSAKRLNSLSMPLRAPVRLRSNSQLIALKISSPVARKTRA